MNELILEIMKLVLEKSGTSKNVVDFGYDTINSCLTIYVFKNGFNYDFGRADYKKMVFFETEKSIENELIEILEYLKRLED